MADDKLDERTEEAAEKLRNLGPSNATRAMRRAYPKTNLPAVVPGRVRADFDLEDVRKLAQLNLTALEAAGFFGVSQATMKRRLSEPVYRQAWEEGRAAGRRALRRKQMERALDGSDTMLIWLGKQLLDQSDKPGISDNVYDRSEVSISMVDFEKILEEAEAEVLEAEYEIVDDGPDVRDDSDGDGGGEAED